MNPDIELITRILSGAVPLPVAVETSPLARALGMRVAGLSAGRVDGAAANDGGEAITLFDPAETFVQGAGVIQGGAVAAMLDFAMIVPVMAAAPDCIPATTNLDTIFYRPAPLAPYEARANIRRRTRSAIFAQASLLSLDGVEIASASATVLIRPGAAVERTNTRNQ